jgi:hypothetical protein
MKVDLQDELVRAAAQAPSPSLEFERLVVRRDRSARSRKVGTIVLALVIGSAGVFGAYSALGPHETTPPASAPSDFQVLPLPVPNGLALPAGDYFYRHLVTYWDGAKQSQVQVWWGTDDSGRLIYGPTDDTTFGPGQIPRDAGSLASLSTDAATLEQQMVARISPQGASPEPSEEFSPGPGQPDHVTAGMVRSIGDLLGEWNVSPALSAALFRVTAGMAGVEITRNTVDPVGRPAIELSVTTEAQLKRWWFDPQTQQVLARQSGDGSSHVQLEIVQAAGIVDSTTATNGQVEFIPAPEHPLQNP